MRAVVILSPQMVESVRSEPNFKIHGVSRDLL